MRKDQFNEGRNWGPLPWPLGAAISRSVGQSASPFILQLSSHLLGRAGRATRGQSHLTLSKRHQIHSGRQMGGGTFYPTPSHKGGGIDPHSQRDPTRRITDFIGGCRSEPRSSLPQPPAPAARLRRMRPPLPTRETAPGSRVQLAPALRPPSPTRAKKKKKNFFFPSSSSSLSARPGEAPGWRAGEEGRVKGARGHGSGHAPQSPPPASPRPVPPASAPGGDPDAAQPPPARERSGHTAPGDQIRIPAAPPFQPPNAVAARPGRRAAGEKRPSLSPAPEPPTGARDAATAQLPRRARKMPGAEARPRRERPPPPRACGPALPAPPPRPPGSRAKQRAGGRRPRGGGAALTGPAAPSGGRRELRLPAGEARAPPSGASLPALPTPGSRRPSPCPGQLVSSPPPRSRRPASAARSLAPAPAHVLRRLGYPAQRGL